MPAAATLSDDLYHHLGVSPDASPARIRSAYLALVRRYHPDSGARGPEALRQLLKAQHAYRVLSDPQRRREYDRARSGQRQAYQAPRLHERREGFWTAFRRGLGPWPRRGQDLQARLYLSAEDLRSGGRFELVLLRRHDCGCSPEQQPACRRCRGSGSRLRRDTLVVKLPGPLQPGERMLVRGEGDRGRHGGRAGDLYLQLELRR